MPKFSIITVCLNEQLLERTCDSIINQTFQDFEWIVIDGGSNQETLNIFDKYKNRIDYFISKKDYGIYDGMNKGIKQSIGEWCNFMNAGDCFYSSDILAKVAVDTEKYVEYSVLYGSRIVDSVDKGMLYAINMNDVDIDKLYFVSRSIPHGASFIKRDLFEKFCYYRTDFKIVSDVEFFIKLYINYCKFKSLKYYIHYFDASGISSRWSTNRKYHLQELDKIYKEYFTCEEVVLGKNKYKELYFRELRNRYLYNHSNN